MLYWTAIRPVIIYASERRISKKDDFNNLIEISGRAVA
jgi:hypothetical protein